MDRRSARARPKKDLNFTHASVQKRVRPHVSAADNFVLGVLLACPTSSAGLVRV